MLCKFRMLISCSAANKVNTMYFHRVIHCSESVPSELTELQCTAHGRDLVSIFSAGSSEESG